MKIAVPWARGTARTSQAIWRTSVGLRPSMRTPSSRSRARITSERRSWRMSFTSRVRWRSSSTARESRLTGSLRTSATSSSATSVSTFPKAP